MSDKDEKNDLGTFDLNPVAPEPKSTKKASKAQESGLTLGVFPIYDDVEIPEFATKSAGCFDLATYLGEAIVEVKVWNAQNQESTLRVRQDAEGSYIVLAPGERALVPSGLIFDIPEGYALNVLPRSSTGLKKGISVPHSFGYIDEDYVHQCYLVYWNTTQTRIKIRHGDKLLQAALVPYHQPSFKKLNKAPAGKTDRKGGFGSTNR